MPTEMLTHATHPIAARESGYLAPGVKSSQIPTIKHEDASFADFLNLLNPLNLIPGVSTLNAAMTGEKTPAISSLVGGAVFGGPIGVVLSVLGMAFEEATGKGLVGSLADAVTGDTPQQQAEAQSGQPRDYTAHYQKIANAHQRDYDFFSRMA